MLTDGREELCNLRVQIINRLQRLLTGLLAGQAKPTSSPPAKATLVHKVA